MVRSMDLLKSTCVLGLVITLPLLKSFSRDWNGYTGLEIEMSDLSREEDVSTHSHSPRFLFLTVTSSYSLFWNIRETEEEPIGKLTNTNFECKRDSTLRLLIMNGMVPIIVFGLTTGVIYYFR